MKIPRDKTGAALSGGIHRAIGAIAVLFLLFVGAAPAAAQPIRGFHLQDIRGTVEAGFLTRLEDRTRESSNSSNFDRVELSQILHLNTYGYIYHPRFLTFGTGLRLEGIEGLAGQSNTRFLWGGDFGFNFLQNHPNSLSIYGTRMESEAQRAFSETYELTSEVYGATFFQKWGWIPFDLSYQYSSTLGGVGDEIDDSAHKVIFDGRYQFSERSDGKLAYDLAFEKIRGRNIRRQNLVASNLSYLGEGDDKRLNTNLRLYEEVDGQTLRNASGTTDFNWEHSDALRTQYIFSGRYHDSGVQDVTNLDANFALRHQLYDSLNTRFTLFGNLEDASFSERQQVGGTLSESYTKQLSDWGRLNISVSPYASMTFNRVKEDTAFVFDERHVLVGLLPVTLRQRDIIESSIVVTNENGSIVYDEGPLGDYIVNQIGGGLETELARTPTSNIADGQLVLVDYEYELIGDNDTLTTGVAVHTSLAFLDHWNVYGRYDNVDYHVLSGDEDDLRLNSFDRYEAGVAFSRKWFSARAKFRDNDASITPSWGYSTSASVRTYGVESWNGRLIAEYAYVNRGTSNETVDRYSVSGFASKRFFNWGVLEAEGRWLRSRWSGPSSEGNDIDAVHVKLKYSWWYGKVEVRFETGFAQLLRPAEDRTVYDLELRVLRVF